MASPLLLLLGIWLFVTPLLTGVLASNGMKRWAAIAAMPLLGIAAYAVIIWLTGSLSGEGAIGLMFVWPIWIMAAATVVAFVVGTLRHRSKLDVY